MTGVLETVFLDLAVRENNAHVVGRRKLAAAPNRSRRRSDRSRIKACKTKTLPEDSTEAILVKSEKEEEEEEEEEEEREKKGSMRSNGSKRQSRWHWSGKYAGRAYRGPPTDKTDRKTDKGKEPIALDGRKKENTQRNSEAIEKKTKSEAIEIEERIHIATNQVARTS